MISINARPRSRFKRALRHYIERESITPRDRKMTHPPTRAPRLVLPEQKSAKRSVQFTFANELLNWENEREREREGKFYADNETMLSAWERYKLMLTRFQTYAGCCPKAWQRNELVDIWNIIC